MRCVPFFIFLFNAAYAIPEEIEGSERGTVLSVLTAAGANGEGDRKLSCTAITGCITLNTDCSCASCNTLSNCVAYDPNTCLCTGCSTLYKVNTKGKCVCAPVTGSVLDKKCAVIGCSSGYTYLSTVKKCCKNVDNCGTYDSATCACTGCVSSIYSLKNGKCVCKTIKGCSQYDTNCNCTGCSSTYIFSSGKCVTQAPTPAPTSPTPVPTSLQPTSTPVTPAPVRSCPSGICYCTLADPCTGVQSGGVYDCSGQDCSTFPCKFACGGATFTGGGITCSFDGCYKSTFSSSSVTCNISYGCENAVFTGGVTACNYIDACIGVHASGGSFNCNVGGACNYGLFSNVQVTCASSSACKSVTGSGGNFNCNAANACQYGSFSGGVVSCAVDDACKNATFDSNTIVYCLTTYSCQNTTFKGGASCVSGGYCPTAAPTSAPTAAPTSAPTNTPQPTTPAPITPVPTAAPTRALLTVMCPSGQYVTGLRIEFGAAINQIFGLLCSGSTSYLATDGMGGHVHDTDLTESPTNSGGYCQYSVGLLLYTPTNTVSSGLTLTDCTVNHVSQGPYGSPSKDVKQFTCPTGKKYVGISGTSESWTDTFAVYYPALLSQFTMICG